MAEGVVLSATGITSVNVWVDKIDHTIEKPFAIINIPTANIVVGTTTYILDIGKVNETIYIHGYLYDEAGESALTKKANLLLMIKNNKNITITWGDGVRQQKASGTFVIGGGTPDAGGNVNKLIISEAPGVVGDAQPAGYGQEKSFEIQLTMIVGINKVP